MGPIETALVAYGPVGIVILVLLKAIWELWKENKALHAARIEEMRHSDEVRSASERRNIELYLGLQRSVDGIMAYLRGQK